MLYPLLLSGNQWFIRCYRLISTVVCYPLLPYVCSLILMVLLWSRQDLTLTGRFSHSSDKPNNTSKRMFPWTGRNIRTGTLLQIFTLQCTEMKISVHKFFWIWNFIFWKFQFFLSEKTSILQDSKVFLPKLPFYRNFHFTLKNLGRFWEPNLPFYRVSYRESPVCAYRLVSCSFLLWGSFKTLLA